jgi:hypothetical protein
LTFLNIHQLERQGCWYTDQGRRIKRNKSIIEKYGQMKRRCYSTAIRPSHGFDNWNAWDWKKATTIYIIISVVQTILGIKSSQLLCLLFFVLLILRFWSSWIAIALSVWISFSLLILMLYNPCISSYN